MIINQIPAIILYLKVPQVGIVKTRLISNQIAPEQAYELQVEMIKDTLFTLANLKFNFQLVISYHPEKNLPILKELLATFVDDISKDFLDKIVYVSQEGQSNGEHFRSAFQKTFVIHNINSCLILGGDTPHIHSSIILESLNYLQNNQSTAIIGPSQNGGFYIFGLNRNILLLETVFSKENEFENLIEICTNQSFNIKTLPFLFDIDTPQDVRTLFLLLNQKIGKTDDKNAIESSNNTKFSFKFLKRLYEPKDSS